MGHGEGEADGYGGVHSVAAVLEHLDAHVSRQRFLRPHYGMTGANGFAPVRGGAESSG
jgi:hypothetical protein